MASRQTSKPHNREVTSLLMDLNNDQIRQVGLALGLNYAKMQRMSSLPSDMVAAWLGEEDDVTMVGEPSWNGLSKALQEVGQTGLAKKVQDKHVQDQEDTDGSETSEEPLFVYNEAIEVQSKPHEGTAMMTALQAFAEEVTIILHVVNENERQAVLRNMTAPDIPLITKPINLLPVLNTVILGQFGGYKSALVQTEQGELCGKALKSALDLLPGTKAVIAIGVAYSKTEYKWGDVLVSTYIRAVTNPKFEEGKIAPRSSKFSCVEVVEYLKNIFTRDEKSWNNKFRCTKSEEQGHAYYSQVRCGDIVSVPWLLADSATRDKLLANFSKAVGGEMEGGELVKLQSDYGDQGRNIGVIIIKGAADYGDKKKPAGKSWQFTAAMAAASYTKFILEKTNEELFDE